MMAVEEVEKMEKFYKWKIIKLNSEERLEFYTRKHCRLQTHSRAHRDFMSAHKYCRSLIAIRHAEGNFIRLVKINQETSARNF